MSGEAKETPESRRLSEPWYVGIVIWATLGSVCSGVVAIASSDPSVGFLSIWYISLVFGSPFLAGYYIRGCVVVPLVGCFGLYAVASVFVFLEIRDLLNEPDLGIGALPSRHLASVGSVSDPPSLARSLETSFVGSFDAGDPWLGITERPRWPPGGKGCMQSRRKPGNRDGAHPATLHQPGWHSPPASI